MLYINTLNIGMTYEAPEPPKLVPGKPSGTPTRQAHGGAGRSQHPRLSQGRRSDDRQVEVGDAVQEPELFVDLVTASNLVFTGVMTGEFQALDADTGKVLWSFQTPSGIVGQPITWERNGKQYVTVMSGIGGVYALRSGDPNLANVPAGASLWTFAPVRQVKRSLRRPRSVASPSSADVCGRDNKEDECSVAWLPCRCTASLIVGSLLSAQPRRRTKRRSRPAKSSTTPIARPVTVTTW